MNFINCHRLVECALGSTFRHPLGVAPFIAGDIGCLAGGSRSEFSRECIWVSLVENIALLGQDRVFVNFAESHAFDKAFIDSALFQRDHVVRLGIPLVAVTYDRNSFGMRCPDSEMHAVLSFMFCRMRAHLLVHLVVGALRQKITVKRCQEYRIKRLLLGLFLRGSRCFLCHGSRLFLRSSCCFLLCRSCLFLRGSRCFLLRCSCGFLGSFFFLCHIQTLNI